RPDSDRMSRRAGLLVPLFSLRAPGDWGVGEIPDLVPLARWAARAGFSVIQLLPVNEAAHGQSSPYFARTAFALDPAYLRLTDIEDFQTSALPDDARRLLDGMGDPGVVHWGPVRALKSAAIEAAYRAFVEREWETRSARAAELARWSDEHAHWLDDYALFSAIG